MIALFSSTFDLQLIIAKTFARKIEVVSKYITVHVTVKMVPLHGAIFALVYKDMCILLHFNVQPRLSNDVLLPPIGHKHLLHGEGDDAVVSEK